MRGGVSGRVEEAVALALRVGGVVDEDDDEERTTPTVQYSYGGSLMIAHLV